MCGTASKLSLAEAKTCAACFIGTALCTLASLQGCCVLQMVHSKELTETKACLTETDTTHSAAQQHETARPRVQMEESCVCTRSVNIARAKVSAEVLARKRCTAVLCLAQCLLLLPRMRCFTVATAALLSSCSGA